MTILGLSGSQGQRKTEGGGHAACLPPGSSHNGFRPPGGGGCLPVVGIRMGSLSGLGPPCAAGADDDGLGPSSPGIAGSSGIFEAPFGDLPECFHISPEAQTHYPAEIQRAIHNVKFIHYHQIQQDKFDEVGHAGGGKGGASGGGRGGGKLTT